jgi:acetoin utilization deacetylase AcuC-like enzyme
VECPDRLRAITVQLEKTGLIKLSRPGTFRPLDEASVAKLHDPKVLMHIKQVCQHGGGQLDPDTVVSPKSFDVALHAAGACVAAVDAVLKGEDKTALCLVRPPGHHATPLRVMGFCLFNNVALAATHARTKHQLDRILVVDWDVHHGNGTQDIFYSDGHVFFLSIHRYPFWPGTGNWDESGTGAGLGFTRNVPVRFGTPRKTYLEMFTDALHKAAEKVKPELVIISAGFDAHAQDPIGSLGLEVEDFAMLTTKVLEVAKTHAAGRVVSCLEGGYNLTRLAESVALHLQTML